jgi:SAM-dependent methyltransferase
MRVCRVCGHVGNPENLRDYRTYEQVTDLPDRARIGTPELPGREFHMGAMAVDIIGREQLDVLVYGAGRSVDNQHIGTLPNVRHVAIADIMRLRDDAEFIDANLPPPRRFDIVIASEVVEHFIEPREEFAHLFSYVEPDGLLVCSTNIYDGGNLSTQRYVFLGGHTSYYSAASLDRLAQANGFLLDLRIPLVATGYAGPRKRYLLLSRSTSVMAGVARYFSTRPYAPSESPTADRELAAARQARA